MEEENSLLVLKGEYIYKKKEEAGYDYLNKSACAKFAFPSTRSNL